MFKNRCNDILHAINTPFHILVEYMYQLHHHIFTVKLIKEKINGKNRFVENTS